MKMLQTNTSPGKHVVLCNRLKPPQRTLEDLWTRKNLIRQLLSARRTENQTPVRRIRLRCLRSGPADVVRKLNVQ